ncbi:MAG: twin-arginine translocase subunit TatC [Acidimicrobiales bacterium]
MSILAGAFKGADGADDLGSMSLMEHLRELRTRIIRSVLAVAAMAIVVWFLYPYAIDVLRDLLVASCPKDLDCKIISTGPVKALSTRMTVSAYGGVGLALPLLLWQLWQFVTPGLYKREKRMAVPFVVSSFVLFLIGVALAWLTLPKAIYFLARLGGDVDQYYNVNEYTTFVVKTAVGFGIGFQFPMLLVFLQLIGLITHQHLGRYRRHAAVGIVVGAALITPGGDVFSLVALSVPMYILYEGSILFGWVLQRRRRRRARASSSEDGADTVTSSGT